MGDAMKIEPAKVSAYVDRVETLEKEKQALGDDVREVYDEAKKAGLNTKALRKIVAKRRAKKPDPQVEAAMHAYELALDEAAAMVSNGDTSLREATDRTGFSKSAIQRQVSQRKRITVSGTPHDPETGEIKNAAPRRPVGDVPVLRPEPLAGADATPQTGPFNHPVTPVPEGGEGAGTISELGQPDWPVGPQITRVLSAVAGYPLNPDRGGSIEPRAAAEEVPRETSGLLEVSGSPERTAQNSGPVAVVEMRGELVLTNELGAIASASERVAPAESEDNLALPPFLRRQQEAVG